MGGAEGVVFAFGALGEARQAAGLAQRADAVAPSGQDLVRIGLVANVPDQTVSGRIEDPMQGDRQFDHAEAGAEVAAGQRHRIDGLEAQLVGQLLQLLFRQPTQVGRAVNGIKERRLGRCRRHSRPRPFAGSRTLHAHSMCSGTPACWHAECDRGKLSRFY